MANVIEQLQKLQELKTYIESEKVEFTKGTVLNELNDSEVNKEIKKLIELHSYLNNEKVEFGNALSALNDFRHEKSTVENSPASENEKFLESIRDKIATDKNATTLTTQLRKGYTVDTLKNTNLNTIQRAVNHLEYKEKISKKTDNSYSDEDYQKIFNKIFGVNGETQLGWGDGHDLTTWFKGGKKRKASKSKRSKKNGSLKRRK